MHRNLIIIIFFLGLLEQNLNIDCVCLAQRFALQILCGSFFFFWIQQTGEVIRPEFVADEWCKIFSDGKGAVEEVESSSCLHAVFVVCSNKKVLASSWALSFHMLGKPSTYCVMESLNTGIYMEVINTNPVDLVMSFSKNSVENTLVQVRLELRSFEKCSGIWLPLCWCSGTWVLLGCSLLILMGARLNV